MSHHHVPLAIVGVSALFPGSSDAGGFWRDILAGRDLIGDVPPTHWLVQDYYDPDPSAPDKTYCHRGGFLGDVPFDPLAFGVPPSIVPATDTSQLLGLIVAQRVLEDATRGQFSDTLRDRTSVILGVTSGQELLSSMVSRLQRPVWVKSLREAGVPERKVEQICDRIASHYVPWQESTFPGLLGNVVAGRIANRLDLGGTNCVTDAACASTCAALSMAASELYLGESDLVITGGVDTLNDIFMYMCFSKTPALSPTGDCRPFSDQADGTLLGEGLGMVALKRLADAEQSGDRVYAVIRGIGTSSDGRAKSVYAPRPEGQAKALARAYAVAGYGPDTVELIEAHGTATKAGDLAEATGLRQAFDATGREDRQWCALGSVKSQIGHTKAAAGAAGLFKAVMALHHKILPPTIKVERPNPQLEIETSPFYLATEARPWVRKGDHPRRASVSSFGFGGSNFHIALEEYAGSGARAARHRVVPDELVIFGAATPGELIEALSAVDPAEGLEWWARTSQARWSEAPAAVRVAVVASDEDDLRAKIADAVARIEATPEQPFSTPKGVHYGYGAEGDVALLFPGQGSQYLGMGRDLAMAFEEVLGVWDLAADLELGDPGRGLHDVVFPRPAFDDAARTARHDELVRTEWAQPAIGAISLGYLRLLRAMGLEAACAGGHSYGEVTALCAAGVFDEASTMKVARRRGELMAEASISPGAMVAVSATVDELRPLIDGVEVVVANHNAPTQVVISGPVEGIERARTALARAGVSFQDLTVATAFHSSVVSASTEPFRAALSKVPIGQASMPVYANSLAAPYPSEPDAVRDLLASQIARPVRFVEQIEAMYAAGARVFLEVGPGSVLTGLVGRILGRRPHRAIAVDRQGKHGLSSWHDALARLVAAGVAVDLAALWTPYRPILPKSAEPRPKMVLHLNGSNYGKPYPPPEGAAALPPPNPEEETVKDMSKSNGAGAHAASPAAPTAGGGTPASFPAAAASVPPAAMAAPTPAAMVVPTPAVTHLAPSPGWIYGYQDLQRHTAEAHTAFQNAMAQAHIAFLQTAETAMSSLAAMVTGVGSGVERRTLTYTPVAAGSPQGFRAEPVAVPAAPVFAPASIAFTDPTVHQQSFGGPSFGGPVPMPATQPSVVMPPPPPIAPVAAAVVQAAPAAAQVTTPSPTSFGAPVAIDTADATALLLEVVADKTGYPAEMLSMDMSLEADLGIDSIKRVEILAGVRAQARHAGGGHQRDGQARDPRRRRGVHAVGHGGCRPHGDRLPKSPLGRYTLEIVDAPPSGLALLGIARPGAVVAVTPTDEVAEALAEELRARGIEARVCDEVPDDATAVVFAGGLSANVDDALAIELCRQAFVAARAFARRATEVGGAFVTLQDTGGDFGLGGSDRALLGGLAGLAKTADLEWPLAGVKAVDVDRGERAAQDVARAVADELISGGPEIEVGLGRDGRRVTLRSVASPIAPAGHPKPGDNRHSRESGNHGRGVLICSGGARGVTASTMVALARRSSRPRIALLGRTALVDEPAECRAAETEADLKRALMLAAKQRGDALKPAEIGARAARVLAQREIRGTIAALEGAGSEVAYFEADVADAAAVARAAAEARAKWGPITAIVHGAGVVADKNIADKTDEQYARVLGPKIDGLRALLDATRGDPIDTIVLFSSVAGRTGNVGQCDYAMANEMLNKVAARERRRRPGCVVKSLGWGPWEAGMVTPALKAYFESHGVPLIPLEVGARMLVDELAQADANTEVVLGGEPRRASIAGQAPARMFLAHVGHETHPHLVDHSIDGTAVLPVVQVLEWFVRAAEALHPGKRVAVVERLRVLRGVPLRGFESGGDSLVVSVADGAVALLDGGLEVALCDPGDPRKRHYSAHVQLADELRDMPAAFQHDLRLGPLGVPIYGDALFHGPELQVIREVAGVAAGGIVGELDTLAARSFGGGPYRTDPAMLDGGLQLAVLWAQHCLGGRGLPTAIERYERFTPGPVAGPLSCAVTGITERPSRALSDIVFSDRDGRVVARLVGVETHQRP